MTPSEARAIRYGILTSMLRIRTQLMRPGEWADPSILPLDSIHKAIGDAGYAATEHTIRAAQEHTVRWCLRHPAPKADA